MYWMGIMFLTLATVLFHWRSRMEFAPEVSLLILSLLYVCAIDRVFESGPRHHIPMMGMLSMLAALLCRRAASESSVNSAAGARPRATE